MVVATRLKPWLIRGLYYRAARLSEKGPPRQVDIPHWASQVRLLAQQVEEAAKEPAPVVLFGISFRGQDCNLGPYIKVQISPRVPF